LSEVNFVIPAGCLMQCHVVICWCVCEKELSSCSDSLVVFLVTYVTLHLAATMGEL